MIVVFVHFFILLFSCVSAYMQQQKLEHSLKYHFWSSFSTSFIRVFTYFGEKTPGNHQKRRVKNWFLCQWQPCKRKCTGQFLAYRRCDRQYRPGDTIFTSSARAPHLKKVNILDVLHHGWGKWLFWFYPSGKQYRGIRSTLIEFFHISTLTDFECSLCWCTFITNLG